MKEREKYRENSNKILSVGRISSENVYENLNFFTFTLYGAVSICIAILINPFIKIWIGEEYVLSNFVAFLIALDLYLTGMQSVTTSFRNAYGLFYKAKYRPILMCILNLIISIILANYIGIAGVILGTIISKLLTIVWLDPYIIYRYGFKEKIVSFYKKYIVYLVLYFVLICVMHLVFNYITITNIFNFMLYGILLFIVLVLVICLLFHRTKEFRYFYDYFMPKINKILKRKKVS